jgi:hypothetical protein
MTACRTTLCVFLLAWFSILGSCASSGSIGAVSAEWGGPNQTWLTQAPPSTQDPDRSPTSGANSSAQDPQVSTEPEVEERDQSLLVGILLYLPNRIFDVFDIARLRVRVGPGLSLGARVTRPVSLALGTHGALFVGLHGPRGEASIPWPVGLESFAGAEISVVDSGRVGNVYYGLGEIGAGTQLLILGLEVGVDPWEVVDFVVGLVTVDLVKDDY